MAKPALIVITWTVVVCFLSNLKGLINGDETTNSEDSQPRQLRLSFGQSSREIVILAATRIDCPSSVSYGDDVWKIETISTGTSHIFGKDELNPDGLHYLHRFVLPDLSPGKTYFYIVKCNNTESEMFYFKVPSNDPAHIQKFLVYGDLGVDSTIIPALKHEVLSGQYSALLHLGDMAYQLETDGGQKGDRFMDMIEPIAGHLPYLTTPGNHESAGDTFVQYRYRFSTPTTTWPTPLTRMWYSIDIGPVHLVSYNTEVFNMTDKQYIALQHDWLISDLVAANKNRDQVPWIIAFAHQPFYCSNSDGDDCTRKISVVRENLEAIFFQYSVDLILNGHEHSYERLWPTNKGTVHAENYTDPSAPVTVISGTAGNLHGLDAMDTPPGPWTAFRMSNGSLYSYGVLSIVNKTHLYWEQKFARNDSILDSFWIEQTNHGEFVTISPEEQVPLVTPGTTTTDKNNKTTHSSFSEKAHEVVQQVEDIIKSNKPLAIGIASTVSVLLLIALVCVIVRCRRKKTSSSRRWERLDYDKSFYSDVKTAEDDFSGDETEIPLDGNGSMATSKLLTRSTV